MNGDAPKGFPEMALQGFRERYDAVVRRRQAIWDDLWAHRPIGRLAVAVCPEADRVKRAREAVGTLRLNEPQSLPSNWTPRWRESLLDDLAQVYARLELPGDGYLALTVPRELHGQTQGLADLFGVRVEKQPDGNFFAHPLAPDPERIAPLRPGPFHESQYYNAVEYMHYAREATGGFLPFRSPVITGPLDTANYLLGPTVLLEWLYTEPDVVHALLDTITHLLIEVFAACREAAGAPPRTLSAVLHAGRP